MIRIKICGITQLEDAQYACELGADAVGFIFYPKSPRSITMDAAAEIARQLPGHVARIGVFVDTPSDEIKTHIKTVGLTAAQFHGNYGLADLEHFEPRQVIAVARVGDAFRVAELERYQDRTATILLDTHKKGVYGGTGETFDWQAAIDAKAYGRIILAGGLNPENVREAVKTVSPYALDVSSGVEASPGQKNHAKLKRLFEHVQEFRQNWQAAQNCPFPLN